MKISSKQVVMLITLLQSSLSKNVVGYLCYTAEQRRCLLDEIINQQSDSPKEMEVEE